MFHTLHFRPSKSAVRYAKSPNRPSKSAVRYAKTQNRLSPLWAPSDVDAQKRNTYATLFFDCTHYGLPATFFAKIDFSFGQDFEYFCQIARQQAHRALVGPVGALNHVNQMSTWSWGSNLVIRARVMRTVRLLPQTPSNKCIYVYKYTCIYVYMYIFIYVYMYICIYVYM